MHRTNPVFRVMIVAAAVHAASCTVSGGDRFHHGCPDGETCSPETPEGLLFRGPSLTSELFDGFVRPIAEGGTSAVQILYPDGTQFLNRPYLAKSTGPALAITGQDGATVTLAGASSGQALLRITDADDRLFDRLDIEVRPATQALVLPGVFEDLPNATDFAVVRGATFDLQIGLVDNGGQRLIDLDLSLSVNAGSTTLNRIRWDWYQITTTSNSTALTAHNGDQSFVIDLPTVDTLTDIALADSYAVQHMTPSTVCFEGLFNDRTVLGVTWTATVEGQAPAVLTNNCVSITAPGPTVSVDVEALGESKNFVLNVSTERRAQHTAPRRIGAPGQRAASLAPISTYVNGE